MSTSRWLLVFAGIFGLGLIAMIVIAGTVILRDQAPALDATPTSPVVIPSPAPPTPTAASGVIAGRIWHDLCASGREGEPALSSAPPGCVPAPSGGYQANGFMDANEPGLMNLAVQLGEGACPAFGLRTTFADTSGGYQFTGLGDGTYCLSIRATDPQNAPVLLPGGWTYPAAVGDLASVTINLGAGQRLEGLNFGWDHQFLPEPLPQPTTTPARVQPTPSCTDRASFVKDVTIPDNTQLQPRVLFDKVWRLKNVGTCTWGAGYALVFTSGHAMGAPASVSLPSAVPPGGSIDLKVNMIAPAEKGTYRGNWHLRNASGHYFGIGEDADLPIWVQIVVIGPSGAGGPITWRGEYYGNKRFLGTPDLVRQDSAIDFNWKRGAPSDEFAPDNFAVRWTGHAVLDEATYRFYVVVDDGARLWVDGKLILDAWYDGEARTLFADAALKKGTHDIRLEYYESAGEARARLTWEKIAATTYPDWTAEYWPNTELSGQHSLVRNDKSIDFDWGSGAPSSALPVNSFSARWSRTLHFEAGDYRFYARADDGIRMYVDGVLVLNEWHGSDGSTLYALDLTLAKGQHSLIVEYFERGGNAAVKMWWENAPAPTPSPTPTPTETPT